VLSKQLEKLELLERAWSAREKAADARRLARRTTHPPSGRVLILYSAEFDAKAAILEREIEDLEERTA